LFLKSRFQLSPPPPPRRRQPTLAFAAFHATPLISFFIFAAAAFSRRHFRRFRHYATPPASSLAEFHFRRAAMPCFTPLSFRH
jgi:hypothetical protein